MSKSKIQSISDLLFNLGQRKSLIFLVFAISIFTIGLTTFILVKLEQYPSPAVEAFQFVLFFPFLIYLSYLSDSGLNYPSTFRKWGTTAMFLALSLDLFIRFFNSMYNAYFLILSISFTLIFATLVVKNLSISGKIRSEYE